MSLIESALQRLRRAEDARTEAAVAVPVAKPAPVVVPVLDEPSRRMSLDLGRLRAAGYLPEEVMERRFADHYRQIKRPLIEKALCGPPEMRLILVTSALPGDGKTFTSINLALSMARERDISVLLIDADGTRARISEVFGLRKEPGLLDALADESIDVESLVHRTDVRGLDVLPAGKFIDHATELLASARMQQIAARIAGRSSRRLAVIDSAPLLASSEARSLIRVPGQVVLVVRAGRTPRRAIVEAAAQVDKSKLQGLIINHARPAPGSAYAYGYYGYEDDARERARDAAGSD